MTYSPDKWKDYGSYYVYEGEQRSIGWKQARTGRVTGSVVTTCVNGSNYNGVKVTPQDVAEEIAGVKKKSEDPIELGNINTNEDYASMMHKIAIKNRVDQRNETSKNNKNYGTNNEDTVRKWYASVTNTTVKEVGLAVPKFDLRLGMSPDGIVFEKDNETFGIGLIEIKCPQKFYKPLQEFLDKGRPYTDEYTHIWRSHYDQMQMGMAVFDKEWCDYIVYCIPENQFFMERVFRNRKYWDDFYSKVKIFIETTLEPLLKSIGSTYPLVPTQK